MPDAYPHPVIHVIAVSEAYLTMGLKNKLITIGIILVCILMSGRFVLASESSSSSGGLTASNVLAEAGWWAKRYAYAWFSSEYSKEGIDYLAKNFNNLIIMNPDPGDPQIKAMAAPLLQILMPMYILAIAATGFYLLFISGAPSGRAKAKKMLVHLIIGMLLVSQSMLIIKLFIDTSTIATKAIVNRASVDISIVPQNMISIFGAEHAAIPTSVLGILHVFLTDVEIELGYFSMLPFLLCVWGTLVVFLLRYAIIILWIILFPLAIALYSFETTRDLGRNLLEQTIVWVLMQEFIAVIALSTALVLMQKQANYLSPSFTVPLVEIQFTGVFDFVPFMGCFVIIVAPLLMLRIFRSFLP